MTQDPAQTNLSTAAWLLAAMRLPAGARVAVAMSGGVDSSAVAGLLVEAGYRVFGLTARLYDVDLAVERRSGTCCAPEDARDARGVADRLGIRHYVLDEREVFGRDVIEPFLASYAAGETPNPCVECNRSLKFDRLVERAKALGAEALATGHYARLNLQADGRSGLHRAVDASKDQSYFLYPMTPEVSGFLRFPLGDLTKIQVRAHAARLGLPTAEKAESMDICFVGAGKARDFVAQHAGSRPGCIVDCEGRPLGFHKGIEGFTIGQRHGLGLGTRRADEPPLYVLDKRADGTVVVGEHAALLVHKLQVLRCVWLSGAPPVEGREVLVQVRHRGRPVPARVAKVDAAGETVELHVTGELHGAGRGQSGVLYDDDRVLGGGILGEAR